MDLEENIRIAFEVYWKNLPVTTELNTGTHSDAFIAGAKSQAAKDYWYNIFKYGDGILEQLKNVPVFDMSKHDPVYKNWIDSVLDLKEKQEEYQKYIDEHPDSPISFDDWGFKVKHYGKEHDILHIVNGKDPHYPYGIIQSDPLYGATKKDFDNVKPKNIGIIGGVGAAITGTDLLSPINSIVPIADIIPEQIISKQELLLMHDKAMERSITEETYKESRAWDIKKEKKVSHKRTNKRR